MKIAHIGNGTVYLTDAINVDMPGENVFLAKDRPDLVEKYSTVSDDYYGRHKNKNFDGWRKGPENNQTVTDRYGRLDCLPFRDGEVDTIIMYQVAEHLSIPELKIGIVEMARILKVGGIARISVPDMETSLKKLGETNDYFYVRHLLGPRNGSRGLHCVGYSARILSDVFWESGIFNGGIEKPNWHSYPAICMEFTKLK